jgi:hypothetical protein
MGDIVSIPFTDQQASGLEALAGAPPLMGNSMTDVAGTRRARPGVSAWSGFPSVIPHASAVVCMATLGTTLIYVCEDRTIWASEGGAAASLTSTIDSASVLDGLLRPQALSLRDKVVFVGGGVPQTTTGVGVAARLGGSPPAMVSIAGIATRIVGVPYDASGTFVWSDPGDSGHSTWDALNFAEAEARPDPLQAVTSNTNELIAFGTQTLQAFSPDANVGFAPGRALNLGLLAPYSIIDVDDQFAFLDRERRFVLTDGRTFSDEGSVISKPIESVLRGLGTVDDCWGFRMRTDRWDACVWFFPTEGRGFIWNRRNTGWSEWRAWGDTGYTSPNITSALYWPEQNVFLVGLETGQIAKLDASASTDLGQPIKVELVSGFQDFGSFNRKKIVATRFKFRRGQTAQSGTAPKVRFSWRDAPGAWKQPVVRDLGLAGDFEPVITLRSLGVTRQRQFRIEYDASSDFTLIGAQAEVETLAA